MIELRRGAGFVQDLIVAEVLARRGEGPLARVRWQRPAPVAARTPAPEVRESKDPEVR